MEMFWAMRQECWLSSFGNRAVTIAWATAGCSLLQGMFPYGWKADKESGILNAEQ